MLKPQVKKKVKTDQVTTTTFQMTMVMDAQSRQFGGPMGYENNMYPSMHAPAFTDPWQHQTSNHAQSRSTMPMPYSHMPPTSTPVTSSGHFTQNLGSSAMAMQQEVPRSIQYPEQQSQFSSPPSTGAAYSTSYPSMNYAQSLAQQQAHQQQQRKGSEVYVRTVDLKS